MNSAAQSFLLDLMLAFILVTVTAFMLLSMSFVQENNTRTARDVATLSGAIFFPYPPDWNASTVITPGFVINHRLNETLLTEFNNTPYNTTRNLVGVASEFYINISSRVRNVTIGIPPPADIEQVAIVRRFAADSASIATIEVMTWDQ